jgi:hypothetical protein
MRKHLLRIYDRYVRPVLYQGRTWWPFWFYVLNADARRVYLASQPKLSLLQKRLADELLENGIASTTLDELFPGKEMLSVLAQYKDTLPEIAEEDKFGKKKFLSHYWGLNPILDFSNPYLTFSIDPIVLDTVNAYMGMHALLKHYDLALTLPVPEGTLPSMSQNWHRDPEEKRTCKVFIYLSDVDAGAGPFTYIPKTTWHAKWGKLFPQRPPAGVYPNAQELEKAIPREHWKSMTAKAGTVLFGDPTGLHFGGYATKSSRLMFTASFTAPSFSERPWYRYPKAKWTPPPDFTPAQKDALDISRRH